MSSTGRNDVRRVDDFYATPSWCVEAIQPYLPERPCHVIDAGCGTGAIAKALTYETNIITGVETDEERYLAACEHCRMVLHGDFLDERTVGDADIPLIELVIANPPFKLAMEFVRRGLEIAGENGTVCMLLRLAFLESQGRRDFNQANPYDVYVMPQRPSFCWVHKYELKCYRCMRLQKKKLVESVAVDSAHRRIFSRVGGQCAEGLCRGLLEIVGVKTTKTDSTAYAWMMLSPSSRSGGRVHVL